MSTAQPPVGTTPPAQAFHQLPCPRPWPVLGNLPQLDFNAMHLSLQSWAHTYGPAYKARIGPFDWLVLSDPGTCAELLKTRDAGTRRGSQLSELLEELGIKGLFTAEGETWERQRKLIARTLTADVVKRFHPTLARLTARLVKRWTTAIDSGAPIDLYRDLKAHALDVTLALAMGTDANVLEDSSSTLQRDIDTLFQRVGARLRTPIRYWHLFEMPSDKAANAAARRIQQTMLDLISACRARRQAARLNGGEAPSNLLEALIDAADAPDGQLSDADIVGNGMTMVFAGEDTTASSMAWMMWYLAQSPDVSRSLTEQMAATGLDDSLSVAFDTLQTVPLVDGIVHEALRLKPAAPMLVSETLKPQRLAHIDVPQGVMVAVLTGMAGLHPDTYAEPQAFNPERGLADAGEGPANDPRKLLSFGAGPRLCPGRYLSLVEMKTLLWALMPKVNIQLLPHAEPVLERYTFTVNPSALPLQLTRRALAPAARQDHGQAA